MAKPEMNFRVDIGLNNGDRPLVRDYPTGAHTERFSPKNVEKREKQLRTTLIVGGILFSLWFLVELIIAIVGHCGVDIITTTDYNLWNVDHWEATIEPKGTLPVCAIWATSYFVVLIAFFVMFGLFVRIKKWISAITTGTQPKKGMVEMNPGFFWFFFAFYYAFLTLAIFMVLGYSNIQGLVMIFLIVFAIVIGNGVAMYIAMHGKAVRWSTIFMFIVMGVFFLALMAIGWSYFAALLAGDGVNHLHGYVYAVAIIITLISITHAILNLYFAWKLSRMKDSEKPKPDPEIRFKVRVYEHYFASALVIIIGGSILFLAQAIGSHL